MRKEVSKAIAIFCSDLHLSLTPPVYRSAEPDWLAAQQRPIDELKRLQEENGGCPIFCAGDIFDKWNSPPELINWAIEHLPRMHCIPGQHDLPEHDLGQIERSAYWTLVRASVITHFGQSSTCFAEYGIVAHSFPFGTEVHPPATPAKKSKWIQVALIHQYNWFSDAKFYGAPAEQSVHGRREEFDGYDLVVSGDNHLAFCTPVNGRKTQFVNCGSLMRRKSDEIYEPCVWLLYKSGDIEMHRLDASQDKYLDVETARVAEESKLDLSDLIEGLGKLGKSFLDFSEAVKQTTARMNLSEDVKTIITRAMESRRGQR